MRQQVQIPLKLIAFKTILLSLCLFIYALTNLFAQQGIICAGGIATGTGGTATYSTGLVSYITAAGANGNINQGLQQAGTGIKFIPGKIEAERFDTKFGPQYIVPTTDVGSELKVVGITNTSWMDYNVTVTQSGIYMINFRVATTKNNAQFQVKLDNTVLVSVNIPNTGGWDNWLTVPVTNVLLTAGVKTIRILSTGNENCDFNWMDWVLITPVTGKFIPGKIEAEEFDTKFGPQYIVPTTDAGGGLKVVGITNTSRMDYNVTVTQPGNYTVNFRVATTKNNAQFQVKSGNTVLATVSIPNTGGWDSWQTVTVSNMPLGTGNQVIRILSTNNENCDFNWMEYSLTGIGTNLLARGKSSTPANSEKQKIITDPVIDFPNSTLGLFPNPVHDQFIIRVNNEYAGAMKVQIIDQAGKVMRETGTAKNKGSNQLLLSAGGLPNGMYVIRIQTGDGSKSIKMIKL